MIIDWLDEHFRDWAEWQLRPVTGWPKRSLMGGLADEGPVGAAIKQHIQHIPLEEMPLHILNVHRAWRELPEKQKRVTYTFYIAGKRWPPYKKATKLDMSKSNMYRILAEAHEQMIIELMKIDRK